MSDIVIVALISLIGTFLGSAMGVLASNNKTLYRLEQLEKKQDKHNSIIERMFKCESRLDMLEDKE